MLSPQDVAALKYRAPHLAVDCLSRALRGTPHDALVLDVACGTGLVAVEVRSDMMPSLLHPGPPTCYNLISPKALDSEF